MFTGLIAATGSVASVEARNGASRITVSSRLLAPRLHEGDSVAVSGVCLTALDVGGGVFHADLAAETLARTTLGGLTPGSVVNLELPLTAGAPLGGHIVQGHVDGTGTLISMEQVNPDADPVLTDWRMIVEVPDNVGSFVVEKGSIAIEGISLTVARWARPRVTVAVIPHTYAATNLHTLEPRAPVNVEADVMMKMAAARTSTPKFEVTLEGLIERGF